MSFPRYSKYKESGEEWLGQIPDHWNSRKVRWLFEIKKRIADALGFDVFSITQQGIKVKDLESNDGQISMDYSKYQIVEIGDFAMNHMDLLTGGVDIASSRGVTSPDYRVITIRDSSTNHDRYFLYLFQMAYRNKIFYAYGQGSSQLGRWRLPTEQFKDFQFPVPLKAEQENVAAFLDRETAKIDELVAEQQRLMELLKEKRHAIISHAVTRGLNPTVPMKASGIAWLGEVPAHWEVVGMTKYLSSLVDYRGRTPTKVDEGVFLLTARNIRDGKVDYTTSEEFIPESEYEDVMRRGKPEIGDVLFTTEAPLGQVANMDRTDVALAQRVIKFRGQTGILDNYFLKYWLMGCFAQADMEQLATGSTALGIKGSKVVQLRLCLPPNDEQRKIVTFLDTELAKLDDLTGEAQRAIDLLQERRTALISAAVTGQIDVRPLLKKEAA
ncbi:MAG: restriction endonuclease subunit S [Verrucomicrobiia bacterium]